MGEKPKLKWGEAINEAGNRYGKLTVVRQVASPGYTSYRCSFWLCRCDCGNEVVRPRQLLHSAGFKACPECIRREGGNHRGLKIQPEWLLGKKFGSRTVIAQSAADPTRYLCRCECGREDYILGSALLAGRQTHCTSCARRLKPDKLIGRKFGMLTVLEKCDPPEYYADQTSSYYRCRCDCGQEIVVKGTLVKMGKRYSCGCARQNGKKGEAS